MGTGKNFSDGVSIQIDLKQGGAVSPSLFNFAPEYAIRKVQENQEGFKLNGPHRLLIYAGVVNEVGDNINTTNVKT